VVQLSKRIVFPPKAPKPVGSYSQAVICDDLIFISGQIPINPQTQKIIQGGIETQTVLKHILESINLTLDNVVKTTVLLTDLGDFKLFNQVYSKYFLKNPPARTCSQAVLMSGALLEIDAIAKKP
jgi:2-iminobutanoate/2-iminopropanoate deaminase